MCYYGVNKANGQSVVVSDLESALTKVQRREYHVIMYC